MEGLCTGLSQAGVANHKWAIDSSYPAAEAYKSEGGEEEDVELSNRSRWDIPIHLDYRDQESSKEDSSDNEIGVEVIEIEDDEELDSSEEEGCCPCRNVRVERKTKAAEVQLCKGHRTRTTTSLFLK